MEVPFVWNMMLQGKLSWSGWEMLGAKVPCPKQESQGVLQNLALQLFKLSQKPDDTALARTHTHAYIERVPQSLGTGLSNRNKRGWQAELEMPEFFLEKSMLQRLMYKNKLQHRRAGHFQHLVEVTRALVLCLHTVPCCELTMGVSCPSDDISSMQTRTCDLGCEVVLS